MAKGKREVLVEEVLEKLAHPQVGPAAVDEQQAFNVPILNWMFKIDVLFPFLYIVYSIGCLCLLSSIITF